MSTEILTPTPEMTEKDRRRLAFQRSDRVQDHGVAANTIERDDEYDREMSRRRQDKLAQRAFSEGFDDLSPAELEAAATHLLEDSAEPVDGPSVLESEHYAIKTPDEEFKGLEDDEPDEAPSSAYANDFDLAYEMSTARLTRGHRGSPTDPEVLYQGRGSGIGAEYETHYTDDEDLSDTTNPLRGYVIR